MAVEPGLAPLSDPPSLEGMNHDERVAAMVDWFYENFEDPAQETPYNGREGGYLYIHGGPYEAVDYIGDAFPDAEEEDHLAAIDQIEADGPEFAPAGHRVLPPDEPEERPEDNEPLADRLDRLGGQLDRIEAVVDQLLDARWEPPAGIGHNRPPVDDDEGPPSYNGLLDIKRSVDEVRQELAKPDAADTADVDVLNRAQGRFAWLKEKLLWVSKQLLAGSVAGVGGWVTKLVLDDPAVTIHLVQDAASTLVQWIVDVPPIF